MVRIGVIGYGYWGPNITRNFAAATGCEMHAVADYSEANRDRAARLYRGLKTYSDPLEMIRSSEIDVIAVVTPLSTHFDLARQALLEGKHVFVEKPFTSTSAEAEQLIELAEKKGLQIMVDHTFLFTGAVRKIKEYLDQGVLGRLLYYDATKVNLGLFQHDSNVVWDLAPHDLSIMDYLVGADPEAMVVTGAHHYSGFEEMAYLTLYFPDNVIAHISVNWLSPVKVRSTLFGGEKKMLVWNDLEPDEKIRLYDKGVDVSNQDNRSGIYDLLVSYRQGDLIVPRVESIEALKTETQYFVECIEKNEKPFNDGVSGWRIVKMLEAADKSLKQRGGVVPIAL